MCGHTSQCLTRGQPSINSIHEEKCMYERCPYEPDWSWFNDQSAHLWYARQVDLSQRFRGQASQKCIEPLCCPNPGTLNRSAGARRQTSVQRQWTWGAGTRGNVIHHPTSGTENRKQGVKLPPLTNSHSLEECFINWPLNEPNLILMLLLINVEWND